MDARGHVDYQACADAAPPGSPARSLSLINLGTEAFLKRDYATAVRLYDEADPPKGSQHLFSDAYFHAFRGAAYAHVGRDTEALANAKTVLAIMDGKAPNLPPTAAKADPEVLYEQVLPILKKAKDPDFQRSLEAYQALLARDWISYSNRAGLLYDLGDVEGALAMNEKALQLQPGHPGPLNNACYILAGAGRAREGLPYCERAVAAAPDIAAIHDSYATALAALGRCADADRELAVARRLDPVSIAYKRTLLCSTR
jgi:tetratricopeptide (TPR) repeat protein